MERCRGNGRPVRGAPGETGLTDLHGVDQRLREILRPLVPPLVVGADGPGGYTLNVARDDIPEPRRYFGGTRLGKRYVSFYLFPVYVFPGLLEGISPGLKRRMQGKSCFNFTSIDEPLIEELADLTRRSFESFRDWDPFPNRG